MKDKQRPKQTLQILIHLFFLLLHSNQVIKILDI